MYMDPWTFKKKSKLSSGNGGEAIRRGRHGGEPRRHVEEPALRHHVSDEDVDRAEPSTSERNTDPESSPD